MLASIGWNAPETLRSFAHSLRTVFHAGREPFWKKSLGDLRLWFLWAAIGLILVILWGLAATDRGRSLVLEREVQLRERQSELSEAFASMEKLQRVLVSALQEDPSKLETLRRQAAPYARLYVNDGPEWLRELASTRAGREVTALRPLPIGMEAGRYPTVRGTPENYLVFAAQTDDGFVASVVDLAHVFGPWLQRQVSRWNLEVRTEKLDRERTWAKQPGQVSTFLADDAFPFDALRFHLDNRAVLRANWTTQLAWLAAGALVFLVFTHGVVRELQFIEERSRFTAMVSHELRTPISAVRMYAEILQNGLVDDADKKTQYLSLIEQEAARLQRLVENLLHVGAIERGSKSFRKEPVDLNELAAAAGVEAHCQPDLPAVLADREATVQVLANLIDNAQKYAGENVSVATRAVAGGVAVDVLDRGPGIPDAEKERIFEPYRRLSLEAGKPGVGLGLAVVKAFMEAQGGRVEVSDRPGGGSVFTLVFPT